MPQFKLHLLGSFHLTADNQPLSGFRSDKARALLAYLAATPELAHRRDTLAALLWPDSPDSTALTNLRITLSNLHKLLTDALTITRQTVQFNPQAVETDLLHFYRLLPNDPKAAFALYQGDFLQGLTLPDAPPFNEWRTIQQERLHRQMVQTLDQLLAKAEAEEQWEEAREVATRQLQLVPWHEPAHRALIRALARQGNHAEALAQYERCRATLRDELGLDPSAETIALLTEISASQPTVSNLPAFTDPLIGREQEQKTIPQLLAENRLITLYGQGGIGKSKLAITIGRRLLNDYAEGVWLVPLLGVAASDAGGIYTTIGASLGMDFQGNAALLDQLTAFIQSRQLLLILDNFEHLADLADSLLPLLDAAPKLNMLITSRVRLHLPGEQTLRLYGLPPGTAEALFARRARRFVTYFSPDEEEQAAITRICRLVEGLPLGIELAAIWVEHFRCTEIADAIAQNRDFLARQQKEGADHHDSLRAVFEHSWGLLTPQEQTAIAQFSIFHGEFGREAALKVTDASLSDLSALLSKSLVRRGRAGRYDLHEVVRSFSAEKWEHFPPEHRTATLQAYCQHYLQRVQSHDTQLSLDLDNIRAAWRQSVEQQDHALLQESVEGLARFMHGLGLPREGLNLINLALERAEGELAAALMTHSLYFLQPLYGSERTIAAAWQALSLTQDPRLRVLIHSYLARALSGTARWEVAEEQYHLQEAAARETGDPFLIASTLKDHAEDQVLQFVGNFREAIGRLETALELIANEPTADGLRTRIFKALATANIRYGNYGRALFYGQQCLALCREQHQRIDEVDALLGCGLAAWFAGMYPEALEYNHKALALAEEIGDREGIGLLKANLSMSYRNAGDLEKSLAFGIEAVPLLDELAVRRIEGQARNRVGHTLLALERWQEADEMYASALEVWHPLNNPNLYEAKAGRLSPPFAWELKMKHCVWWRMSWLLPWTTPSNG